MNKLVAPREIEEEKYIINVRLILNTRIVVQHGELYLRVVSRKESFLPALAMYFLFLKRLKNMNTFRNCCLFFLLHFNALQLSVKTGIYVVFGDDSRMSSNCDQGSLQKSS
jgi:hypothetical protein